MQELRKRTNSTPHTAETGRFKFYTTQKLKSTSGRDWQAKHEPQKHIRHVSSLDGSDSLSFLPHLVCNDAVDAALARERQVALFEDLVAAVLGRVLHGDDDTRARRRD